MVHCTREFLRTPQGSLVVFGAFFSLEVPSGYVKIAIENGHRIVDFSLKMLISHSYVKLPEGIFV